MIKLQIKICQDSSIAEQLCTVVKIRLDTVIVTVVTDTVINKRSPRLPETKSKTEADSSLNKPVQILNLYLLHR